MRRLIFSGMLVSIAGCSAPTTDHWLDQLKDPEVVKRRQAIRELGARPAEAERIVPALASALGDENAYVRHDAAMAFAKFGPDSQQVVPALTLALKDKEKKVRTAAASALQQIDPVAAHAAGIR